MRGRRAVWLAVLLALGASFPAWAAPPRRPVVAELFTSEGCSSCPPADALLVELARRPDVLALAFHVTYWNSLGWKDPFSLDLATARQRAYAAMLGESDIYTPELVVDGRQAVVGSDRAAVSMALDAASREASAPRLLRLRVGDAGLHVDIAAGKGAGTVWLVGFDHLHRTAIGRGENSGRTLLEANIVRAARPVGHWTGAALSLDAAAPEGEQVVALLQAGDGHMLDAAWPSP